jgi:Tfp pilus assembly protein PilN
MRPVNLIPADERRGLGRSRTGPVAYLIVGALTAVLAGVALLVSTTNTISEREAEISRLEVEKASAQARAESMSAFAEFAAMEQARTETVSSLARSRFDWERVLRELALVIPGDVWLIDLTGTVSPDVSVEAGSSSGASSTESSRGQIAGPALELVGCAAGHESVARFVAALRDIDGVTRVGLTTSERPDDAGAETGTGGGGDDCRVRDFISKFEITVAFDEVPVEAAPESGLTAPPVPTDEGGVADAQAQAAEAEAAVDAASAESEQATSYVPGG